MTTASAPMRAYADGVAAGRGFCEPLVERERIRAEADKLENENVQALDAAGFGLIARERDKSRQIQQEPELTAVGD